MKKYMIALAAVFAFTANAGLNTAKVNVDPTIVEKRDIHDVNQDNVVSALDGVAVYKAAAAGSTDLTHYDVNKDNVVSALDGVATYKCAAAGGCDVQVNKD